MNWQTISALEAVKSLKSDVEYGLAQKEAERRLKEQGKNIIQEKKKKSFLKKLLEQFNDFMIMILLAASAISFVLSWIEGSADFTDPIIILLIVIVNAFLGIFQESKAEKALEALKNMSAPSAKVKRNGKVTEINTEDLVTGDIILLETGDFVPADARLIYSSNLKLEESALTGESVAVEKEAGEILDKYTLLGDLKNMILAGTSVSCGHGMAVVTETGMNTQMGKIAGMILNDEEPPTPLQIKLEEVGKVLGLGAVIICAAVFLVGMFHNFPPFEMFMTAVSLAVAAIPEGLPAIVTIMLAMGVQRMVKQNAIVKRLPAVETLGSASVICSDKTGTLTQNKMTVMEAADVNGNVEIESKKSMEIFELMALCNNARLDNIEGKFVAGGEATEVALINAAASIGKIKYKLDEQYPRVMEIPFDSERKLMTTVHKLSSGKYRVITKGALDLLLNRCTYYAEDKNTKELTKPVKDKINFFNNEMGKKALRVISAAYKDIDKLPNKKELKGLEQNLIFVGFAGMIDPPRAEAKQAVKACREAGIKPVMVTGDHVVTASAIAEQLGIMKEGEKAITGEELNRFSNEELSQEVKNCSVFARVTPEHKVRIVKAFQANGAIVAMTGDGVNDAPALKIADIGCAMGINGTDVAKGSADMILTDDNFATIVSAIREGRGIYSNIIKSVHFLLSSNIGEILTIFVGIIMGLPSPLLAIHLLWVNLVTDSLPAIALGLDPADKDIMKHKPRNPKKSLFADGLWWKIGIEGAMIGALSLLAFSIGFTKYDVSGEPLVARTMAFSVLSISQLFHAFNMRSKHSLFTINPFGNKYLVMAFIAGVILQAGVIIIPPLAQIFKVAKLTLEQWAIVAGLSFVPIIMVELQKWANSKDFAE